MTLQNKETHKIKGTDLFRKNHIYYHIWIYIFFISAGMALQVYKTNKIQSLGVKYNKLLIDKESLEKKLSLKQADFQTQVSSSNIEFNAIQYLKMTKDTGEKNSFVIIDKNNVFNREESKKLPDLFCTLNESQQNNYQEL